MKLFTLQNASYMALFVAPISPALHLGFAAYAGARIEEMPAAVAIVVGAAMALTVELLGIGSGHMLAEAVAARRIKPSLKAVGALVAIYVILGMALSFGANIWGAVILPAGAFVLASLVYLLRGLQEGSEKAVAAVAEDEAEANLKAHAEAEEAKARQRQLEDEDRQRAYELQILQANQAHEIGLAKEATKAAKAAQKPVPSVQNERSNSVQKVLNIQQMDRSSLEHFIAQSPTVLAKDYGVSRGTVYNRKEEATKRLAQMNGAH